MSRIPLFFWGLVAVVSVVWFAADSLWVSPFAYFPFRSVFVQYSGILALVMMAVALLLALRLRALERWVGGLTRCTGCTNGWALARWCWPRCTGGGRRAPSGWWAGAGWRSRPAKGPGSNSPVLKPGSAAKGGWQKLWASGPSMRLPC